MKRRKILVTKAGVDGQARVDVPAILDKTRPAMRAKLGLVEALLLLCEVERRPQKGIETVKHNLALLVAGLAVAGEFTDISRIYKPA